MVGGHHSFRTRNCLVPKRFLPGRLLFALAIILLASSVLLPSSLVGQQEVGQQQRPSMKAASKAVRASTVTIRVDRNPTMMLVNGIKNQSVKPQPAIANPGARNRSVAVFSGVLVKQGFVATPLFLPNTKDPEVRITLPNGEQTRGRPRILDEYSGLAIIAIEDQTIPCLKCCETHEPFVGDWVVSGAAWGRQEALVSLGMISGIGYRLPNAEIEPPPMIVCDLRAAQTSKGSGVVAANGKLIGIVMAISNDRKWTYVVPSSHVHRLLRSLALHDNKPDSRKDEILVLKRQVPRMGVRIDSIWNAKSKTYSILVASTTQNGPADQAGLQMGDRIKSVNGKIIRAWYDVVRDVSNKQPGDKVEMGVIRQGKDVKLTIVLGGGFAASGENILRLKDYIKPEIEIGEKTTRQIAERNSTVRYSQLLNYSIQNLAPSFDAAQVQDLIESLRDEKEKNKNLQNQIDALEKKFDRLFDAMRKAESSK